MSKPIPSTFDDFLKKELTDEEFKIKYEKMKRLIEEIQKDIDEGKGWNDNGNIKNDAVR